MFNFGKIISLILAVMMTITSAACGSTAGGVTTPSTSAPTTNSPATEPSTEAPDDTTTEAPEDTTEAAGKVLVVYFSGSGNTERVANDIAEATGGDLFEIIPTEPYTSDDLNWTATGSRVNLEHDDESLRDVPLTTTEVENWEDYDTVFIGYPIWWAIAAWPVNTFVKNNDFTGKTVIPFATSASSGMGQSGKLLAEMAGSGDWQEGQRFRSGASTSDVVDWVNELGLAD